MYQRIELLNDWLYSPEYQAGMEKSASLDDFKSVALPHANVELPYSYFDETVYQTVSCYKKMLPALDLARGQRAVLRFEGVMACATVWLDGFLLGGHKGGYTPFEFDITEALENRHDHWITVMVDATEREDVPPFGGQIDYLTYGGIYREVYLDLYQDPGLTSIHVLCDDPLNICRRLELRVGTENSGDAKHVELWAKLLDNDGVPVALAGLQTTIEKGRSEQRIQFNAIENVHLWSCEQPYLYTVEVSLVYEGRTDVCATRYGFRSAEFRPDGFYLNGNRVQIRGLNRHQAWPYVGYAMPKRAQIKDADILKYELGLNLVRASHYPQSVHFLNRCDEIGLLVFEEIPGWQHIGDESWKLVSIQNVEEMIRRDWNHPSIIIWGVRINESQDDHAFYERTNSVAHALDPERATGGVRYITNSELLEDVYTMNDFIHSGGMEVLRDQQVVTGLSRRVPYLVTEYNGHMYPTKKTDNEERQCEHVMRHLRVQQAACADPWISGAIGWCAFDYNTHKDFGSGDRICHHGVMDMFRLPKFAAWVYASQVSPDQRVVLKPVTWWARGERSIGGVLPLIVLTNCDRLELRFGNFEPIPINRKAEEMSALAYPPFIIDERDISLEKIGAWGMKWEDATITAYLGDKIAATVRLPANPLPSRLSVESDDAILESGAKDVTRCVVSLFDQYDNVLPFSDAIVTLSIEGPARIQGPQCLALKGGSIAFWVESSGAPGCVVIQASCAGMPKQKVQIEIR